MRVTLLLAATMLVCFFDLALTLTFVTSTGMAEANPLARIVMEHGSPAFVVVWKLATMAVGLGILFWARKSKGAEIGAWGVLAVMIVLSVHWLAFAGEVSEMDSDYGRLSEADDPRWISITP